MFFPGAARIVSRAESELRSTSAIRSRAAWTRLEWLGMIERGTRNLLPHPPIASLVHISPELVNPIRRRIALPIARRRPLRADSCREHGFRFLETGEPGVNHDSPFSCRGSRIQGMLFIPDAGNGYSHLPMSCPAASRKISRAGHWC